MARVLLSTFFGSKKAKNISKNRKPTEADFLPMDLQLTLFGIPEFRYAGWKKLPKSDCIHGFFQFFLNFFGERRQSRIVRHLHGDRRQDGGNEHAATGFINDDIAG